MLADKGAKDLQNSIKNLSLQLSEEHMSVIKKLGIYFEDLYPTDVYEPLIEDTGRMLNNIYNNFPEDKYKIVLKEQINDAISAAAVMNKEIRDGRQRSKDFYRQIKPFGKELIKLSVKIRQSKL